MDMVLRKAAKQNKRAAGLLAFMLVFVMIFVTSAGLLHMSAEAVSRAELDALRQQQTQLAEEKAGIQSRLQALEGQVASQTEMLELLSAQLDTTRLEIDNITLQIVVYTNSIGSWKTS